jgi:hypothetical protein
MAEQSIFWPTGTTGDGANPITQTQTLLWMRDLCAAYASAGPHPEQCVLAGVLGELAVGVTDIFSPITVASGAAIIEGFYYRNDATINISVLPPSVSTRTDIIALRADWSARTVRVVRIAGTEGAGAPALTQVAGTTWEVPLARVTITTGGTITTGTAAGYDPRRRFLHFGSKVAPTQFDPFAVQSALSLVRSGGNASDWATAGTTGYNPVTLLPSTPAGWTMKAGVVTAVGTTAGLTFSPQFSGTPIILANKATVATVTNAFATLTTDVSGATVQWLAIGPTA